MAEEEEGLELDADQPARGDLLRHIKSLVARPSAVAVLCTLAAGDQPTRYMDLCERVDEWAHDTSSDSLARDLKYLRQQKLVLRQDDPQQGGPSYRVTAAGRERARTVERLLAFMSAEAPGSQASGTATDVHQVGITSSARSSGDPGQTSPPRDPRRIPRPRPRRAPHEKLGAMPQASPDPQVAPRSRATAARIYDWLLEGSHNFEADADMGKALVAAYPDMRDAVRANRAFLRRAVRFLAGSGVRQFLDIGSGIPTEGNVHEIAQATAADARVVYVDIDPVAVSESLVLLEGNPHAVAIRADMRDPEAILSHPRVQRMLDWSQPVAVLMAAVLHFVVDDDEARELVTAFVAHTAPGSYFVVSHAAAEMPSWTAEDRAKAWKAYQQSTGVPGRNRTHDQVADLFTGLSLMEPGVVWVPQWRPQADDTARGPLADTPPRSGLWCGVGYKP